MNRKIWITPALAGTLWFVFAGPAFAQAPKEPLTLRRAVALAVQNSRELALARAQLSVAERIAGVNRSDFRPNFFTGSGAAYTNGFPLGAPTAFNLSYVQTLFNSPARGELRAAEQGAEIHRLGVERMRDTVILRAVAAYLELAKVRSALDLLRKERASAQKIADVTRDRAGAGLELPIEITRAQLTAARVEQRIVQLESREEGLENELRSLTGLPPGERFEVAAEEIPAGPEQTTREMVELALANSLELKEAERERRAQQERVRGERGGYFPSVDIVGQYGLFSRFNNYDDYYKRFERHNVAFGIKLNIPLYSARTSAAVSLAESRLRAAEIDLQKKRNDVEMEVRRLARESRETDAAREVARLELQLAQENLRILQARFEEGRASLRDLERARLDEMDKWREFLDADFARQQTQLDLLKATGQLARVFQ
jgi:outer membrane protein TolC